MQVGYGQGDQNNDQWHLWLCTCVGICLCMSTLQQENGSNYQLNTKLGTHRLSYSRLACIDPEVKRSKVKDQGHMLRPCSAAAYMGLHVVRVLRFLVVSVAYVVELCCMCVCRRRAASRRTSRLCVPASKLRPISEWASRAWHLAEISCWVTRASSRASTATAAVTSWNRTTERHQTKKRSQFESDRCAACYARRRQFGT